MYDYHLWVVLRESTEESDCGSLGRKTGELRRLIRERLICKPGPEECILSVNYSLVFQCSGSANHRGEDHKALLAVLRHIATELPGSYGLVYWYDDEDPGRDRFDGYRVIVIARGLLHDRFDPFLSPIVPHIEDQVYRTIDSSFPENGTVKRSCSLSLMTRPPAVGYDCIRSRSVTIQAYWTEG